MTMEQKEKSAKRRYRRDLVMLFIGAAAYHVVVWLLLK